MKKISLYVDDTTYEELRYLPGTIAEHIRRAIIDYLEKKQDVSYSISERSK